MEEFNSKNTEEIFETLNLIREKSFDFDVSEEVISELISELQFWTDESYVSLHKRFIEEIINKEISKKKE